MRRLKKDAAKDLPLKHELKEKIAMPSVQKRHIHQSLMPI